MKTKTYFKMFHTIAKVHNNADDVLVEKLLTIRRLAKKHHRLAEMDCNGEGVIRGVHYYNGTIDDYARREYGQGVKSAYVVRSGTLNDPKLAEETTVFDVESEKVQDKIIDLVKKLGKGWKVEFQGDPRGNTVKLYYGDRYIDVNF